MAMLEIVRLRILRWFGQRTLRNQVVTDRRVVLDEADIEDCQFFACEVHYSGYRLRINRVVFNGCSWHFHGPAGAGMVLLEKIAKNDPAFILRTFGIAGTAGDYTFTENP